MLISLYDYHVTSLLLYPKGGLAIYIKLIGLVVHAYINVLFNIKLIGSTVHA